MTIKNSASKAEICPCCMESHKIQTVNVCESMMFGNVDIEYIALYNYCHIADEYYETEEQMGENYKRFKMVRDAMANLGETEDK